MERGAGRGRRTVFTVGLALFGGVWLVYLASEIWPLPVSMGHTVIVSAASRSALLAFSVALALRLHERPALATVLLSLVAFADGLTHLEIVPTIRPDALARGVLAAELRPLPVPGVGAAWVPDAVSRRVQNQGLADREGDYVLHRLATVSNTALLDGVATVGGFWALDLRREQEYWALLPQPGDPGRDAFLDFAGVTHELELEGGLRWKHRPSALPWITAGQEARFADDEKLPAYLVGDFDPRRMVYLASDARATTHARAAALAGASDVRFGNGQVSFVVDSAADTWAVVAQTYYPGWTARVDDRPVPIHRANLAFQALEIPRGRHQVTLAFESVAFERGLRLGAVGLLAILGLALLPLVRDRRLRLSAAP
jgi:hypothetical protein